jgi:hypothetical protein
LNEHEEKEKINRSTQKNEKVEKEKNSNNFARIAFGSVDGGKACKIKY